MTLRDCSDDDGEFRDLYIRYRDSVLDLMNLAVKDQWLAEDLAQEAFLKTHETASHLHGNQLVSTLRDNAIDIAGEYFLIAAEPNVIFLSIVEPNETYESTIDDVTPALEKRVGFADRTLDSVISKENKHRFLDAISTQLPPLQRNVMFYHYFLGLETNQIAAATFLDEKDVDLYLLDATSKLIKYFSKTNTVEDTEKETDGRDFLYH